ncbi:MAG: hypothetical protein WKF50_12310 [Nocardioides sp.]
MNTGKQRRGSGPTRGEPDPVATINSYARWWLYAAACFGMFFVYLFMVSEVVEDPGAARLVAHAFGLGVVVFGGYSAYRGAVAGGQLASLTVRAAKKDLARQLRSGGQSFPSPADLTLPVIVEARPRVLREGVKDNPAVWLVAGVSLAGLAWEISSELGWSFLLTLAGCVALLVVIVGLGFAANSRGRLSIGADTVRIRTAFRSRSRDRRSLAHAVEVTTMQYVPRAGMVHNTTVHVVGTSGRRVFALNRDVYDAGGVATALGALGLRLHRVADPCEFGDLEGIVPGSTSFAQRRPMTLGIVIALGIVAVVIAGVVLASYVTAERERGSTTAQLGSDLRQTLTVDGQRGSLYGEPDSATLTSDERRLLLYATDAIDAHPERGCRLGDLARLTGGCNTGPSARLAGRLPALDGRSQTTLLSRSRATERHDVTLETLRREDDRQVLSFLMSDDGGPPYGIEVALIDPVDGSGILIDDVLCTGDPASSVYLTERYRPCG